MRIMMSKRSRRRNRSRSRSRSRRRRRRRSSSKKQLRYWHVCQGVGGSWQYWE